ncbi:hypothetical protein [Shinella sp.]|uniref:hypothetical protein n=1 Tax=Shinella sp. TaxID=1870904 RepID=UPI0029B9F411|nr:hypothetical protein [Shinella sp.]MDX3976700.1 hypothetical protein [Shinella sp.]
MSSRFNAFTKYGDWEGDAAADNSHPLKFAERLRSEGKMTDDEMLIGLQIDMGEHFKGRPIEFYVKAIIAPVKDFEGAKERMASSGLMENVRVVEETLNADDFLDHFKRLAVTLTLSGLDLLGKEYTSSPFG